LSGNVPSIVALCFALAVFRAHGADSRPPRNDADLRYWLENMVEHHGYTHSEVSAATGLSEGQVRNALRRFEITPGKRPARRPGDLLRVLPYPGGRHPRVGFLDGAIDPQRETKVSVFTPWDESSYVVIDVPEAIWSHSGLLYLAHTHVPTIWAKANVTLKPLEWERSSDGSLSVQRVLPNGVAFRASVRPGKEAVQMELMLTNGSTEILRDLRVQNCVMLKAAGGFEQQTNANKIFMSPYVACRSNDGARWIITAWDPCHRAWANAPVPCLHSDPKFPDCPPGETRRLRGWLSFYEGTNVNAAMERIESTGWRAGH
jgi:hypothetical protein